MSIGCPLAQYLSCEAEKLPHRFPFVFSLQGPSNQPNVEEHIRNVLTYEKYMGERFLCVLRNDTVSPI